MMHIVILDAETLKLPENEYQKLNQLGTYTMYPHTSADQIIERAYDADAIITNKVSINAYHMKQLPNLKYIGLTATGMDNIDTEAAPEYGVKVNNVPAYASYSVAQLTIGLLIDIAHQISHHHRAVKSGNWAEQKQFSFWERPLMELAGLKLGLVGFGDIAQKVADIATSLGMTIQVYNRTPSKVPHPYKAVDWQTLLKDSDIVSLHCPLTRETQKCINSHSLAQMKQNAILLNASRGGLIDEQALYQALTEGPLYAAGLDVMTQEPPQADNPLLQLDNCYITPHIGWATMEARLRAWQQVVEQLANFLNQAN